MRGVTGDEGSRILLCGSLYGLVKQKLRRRSGEQEQPFADGRPRLFPFLLRPRSVPHYTVVGIDVFSLWKPGFPFHTRHGIPASAKRFSEDALRLHPVASPRRTLPVGGADQRRAGTDLQMSFTRGTFPARRLLRSASVSRHQIVCRYWPCPPSKIKRSILSIDGFESPSVHICPDRHGRCS
jgi:hypothetical protein